jgi:hypothetical protein
VIDLLMTHWARRDMPLSLAAHGRVVAILAVVFGAVLGSVLWFDL